MFENNIPIRVSLFYARSTNFQPFSNRVDVYGHALGAPQGKTKEVGVLLETRDQRLSLKVNHYRTDSSNQNSSALGGAWQIGTSQAWAANWVNRFEFGWTGDTVDQAWTGGPIAPDNWQYTQFHYGPDVGETVQQAQQRQQSVVSAWRAWQKSVSPDFYKAWHIDLNNPHQAVNASTPAGFTVTEDSTSQGYEVEFNAQVTRNWRLNLNASKTDAQRQNVGGNALSGFIAAYEKFLDNGKPGAGGDLRIWWGGAGGDTILQEWNKNVGAEYHQRKLQEGSDVPELRKWRTNLVTNYDFDRGILKGVGVGTGLRWQSSVVIGYKPYYPKPSDTSVVSFDMTDPYKGPAETSLDAWISYRRRIAGNLDWSVQLNVSNLNYNGDALIPINSQPLQYGGAAYRIRPPRTWQLSNTIRF
jgi:hypothetical protein